MKLPIIQSMWIGDSLSKLEQLCIQSFLDHGHEFHLYIYDEVSNIPSGCVVKDGNEILPATDIFQYQNGSYAGFADWFRYEMICRFGGFWVDTDMVCVKPFNFGDELIIGQEKYRLACTAVIGGGGRGERGHDLIAFMRDYCRNYPAANPIDNARILRRKLKQRILLRGRNKSRWADIGGPGVLTRALNYYNLWEYCKPYPWFYPIYLSQWNSIFDDTFSDGCHFFKDTHGLHLWTNYVQKHGVDKNATFPHNSLIEQLKRKHNIK